MSETDGNKAIDLAEVERRSVIERQPTPNANAPISTSHPAEQLLWFVTQTADEITPWGRHYRVRDMQLRQFITEENIFASALGIICSRNAGFSWRLDGPPRIVDRYQEMFDLANLGEGWHDLIIKTSIDLYTQDNGAFWEIVRSRNNPSAPVIGVNHLDAARCIHTGAREAPVIYQDYTGKYHLLRWYQVVTFAEMPAPIEAYYGRQYCALTRLLRNMQIRRNIDIYDYERTGGRNTRAVHLVKGITTQQLKDAVASARAFSDNSGLLRYQEPLIIGTIDPTADVGHDTIPLVDKPDKWDSQEAFKQYINLISMAFESDYQEFAPLPGGGLGTGNQSEILHLKNRGKGPGLFMKLITHAINFRIFPRGANIRWYFDEQDLEAEKSDAEVRAIRAQTRSTRIQSGEITPQVARQLARDEGDLTQEYIDIMGEQDLTENVEVDDDSQASVQSQDLDEPVQKGIPAPDAPVGITRNPNPNVLRRTNDPNRSAARQPNPTARRPRQAQRNPT